MAWCLVGAKPLSEPMLEYCKIGPLGTNFSEILINYNIFIQENAFESVVWKHECFTCAGVWNWGEMQQSGAPFMNMD